MIGSVNHYYHVVLEGEWIECRGMKKLRPLPAVVFATLGENQSKATAFYIQQECNPRFGITPSGKSRIVEANDLLSLH